MGSALVLAGGGITGIAWESGVLAGLAAGGIDTQSWDLVVGTSAGAYVGARLTGDGSPEPLFAVQTSGNDAAEEDGLRDLFGPRFVRALQLSRHRSLRWVALLWMANFGLTTLMRHAIRHGIGSTISLAIKLGPRRAETDLQEIAACMGAIANLKRKRSTVLIEHWEHALGPRRPWPATRLIATAIDSNDGSRMLFDASSGVSLVGAVAASTCLPGLLAPIELLGRRYIDGGIASPANGDIAIGHEEVWIVAPGAAPSVDRDVAQLQSSGALVHLVRPSATAERALATGMGQFDPRRRLTAAQTGFADGRAAAEAVLGVNKVAPARAARHRDRREGR
jgi:NTE family protein